MGRDVTLYPEKATKKDLRQYLESLGFVKCNHFWDWPEGTLNYSWFDDKDYKSITGVSADIYPVDDNEKNFTENQWALHVRNTYSASWYDVKMLNDVLRGSRRLFGGTIRGDYGTNRYAPLWDDDSTPISRGISSINNHVKQEISSLKFALPDQTFKSPELTGGKADDFINYTNSLDPSRVIYNGLVPFAVSMFEYFFAQTFKILIKYDPSSLEKRINHKQKIEFETLLELQDKELTIESVIARNYTFQNLNQLNKAYKDWLNIDVRKILYKRKKIGNEIKFLENRIAEIIQYRHGIVHQFAIDRSLTKEGYIHILDAIETSINEFISFIEKKYSFRINED